MTEPQVETPETPVAETPETPVARDAGARDAEPPSEETTD